MAQAKKKKKFFEVDVPIVGTEVYLYGFDIESLDKRIIQYDLTRSLKGKGTLLSLDVKVQDGKATATPREMKIMQYFLKRMIKKRSNYVEDSIIVKTKDSEMTLKPLLVTRRKVSRAVRKALREKLRGLILEYTESKTTQQIFEDVMKNKLQKELSLKLKKIYPLSLCEIRRLKVEKRLDKTEKANPKIQEEDNSGEQ